MESNELELRKELWAWRGMGILAIVIFTLVSIVTFVKDKDQHASDNKERAHNWQMILSNQERVLDRIQSNYDATMLVDEHLRQCSSCHSHPDLARQIPTFPPFTKRKEREP